MIRKGNPLPRVPGGEFEQLVALLKRERRLTAQRQRFGFNADASLFIRNPRPAKLKKPLSLIFWGKGRR